MSEPLYAELDALTNFSFLEGGSHPAEMVGQAHHLGLAALGIADRNTLAGVVRAHAAAKTLGFPILIGARLTFLDGTELIVYPRDRAAYGRLCRLLTLGKSEVMAHTDVPSPLAGEGGRRPDEGSRRRPGIGEVIPFDAVSFFNPSSDLAARGHLLPQGEKDAVAASKDRIPKAETRLTFEQAVAHGEGLIALARAPDRLDAVFEARLAAWRAAWPDDLYLAANLLFDGRDRARLAKMKSLATRTGAPMVAVGAALYHHFDRRRLQDVLTCIREKTTIDEAGFRLQANAERYLKPAAEMLNRFKGHEAAVARTVEIAQACRFSLDELSHRYPDEPVPPGKTADQHLRKLAIAGARKFYPKGPPRHVVDLLRKELKLIRKLKAPHYFLTVHDIVRWARTEPEGGPILCQGRGSAANSVVCYCLGVTAVDPAEQNVLFERFLSSDRSEPPDIDVDFEHERREEVMQYVYRRYGRHRAAICATVIHYRPRSAIRDVGKALGLTEDVTAALANTVWGSYGASVEDQHVDGAGLRRDDPRMKLALELTAELIRFPRHLSQHVGGFVLTQGPLVDMIPVGNAAMPDRTFVEWDKDDLDALFIMKVDVLALGMLTAIRKGFALIAQEYGVRFDLTTVPKERGSVYRMLSRAESLGVFQVESRAQMAMLPRLRPAEFYDLVVEVAIVRPGPIQGNMVHPYLRQREEKRRVEARGEVFQIDFPKPHKDFGPENELRDILGKTLGVPLFQEQAMRIAMDAAKFSGPEANRLRKDMATFRGTGRIGEHEDRMVGEMKRRGYPPEFCENVFKQIRGFGEYGFPESHAVSFAKLVYVSAWLKRVFPEVFAAALLNSQPMGFYSPAQIISEAKKNNVEVRHPDVNASDWDNTLEARARLRRRAIRIGFRQIDGFHKDWALQLMEARKAGSFASLDDLRTRARLPPAALEALAAADALGSLDLKRRPGLWAAKGLPGQAPAPLFAFAGLDEQDGSPPAALPAMPEAEEVVHDYETLRLSLKGHPMQFLRDHFARLGAIPTANLTHVREKGEAVVAGVVLVRQRPGSANGVCFITLEDETGVANAVVWPKMFERFRPQIMGARLLLIRGQVQRAVDAQGEVIHLVAEQIVDRTADLARLSDGGGLRHAPPIAPGGDGPRIASPERGEQPDFWSRNGLPAGQAGRVHPRDVRILPPSRDFH